MYGENTKHQSNPYMFVSGNLQLSSEENASDDGTQIGSSAVAPRRGHGRGTLSDK